MSAPDVWQTLLPPGPEGPTGPDTWAAALPCGRRIILPIRVLPEGTDNAVASLIVNQAAFAVLDALASALADALRPDAPDLIAGVPTLRLPLAEAVARRLGHTRMIPLGTSAKFWYDPALFEPLRSITTPGGSKRVYIDLRLLPLMTGRRIAVIDDVFSTGASIAAVLRLMASAGIAPVALGRAMLHGTGWRAQIPSALPVRAVLHTSRLIRTSTGWQPEETP